MPQRDCNWARPGRACGGNAQSLYHMNGITCRATVHSSGTLACTRAKMTRVGGLVCQRVPGEREKDHLADLVPTSGRQAWHCVNQIGKIGKRDRGYAWLPSPSGRQQQQRSDALG